ncbi:Argonaute siRNA chaperone complex subunit Arb1-domain-containing protein [Podospora appendiculata]|uniref:Argonaute siRNA chaperone complex subunit Arb1-domain-containing protein n=1 Tax=Podospora appendiculata TaxID=314037 RepID=A0AAE0X8V2_9PEZI|nr:Argonaute siRNA chaperone complex subunit Arb1-domain-containing protein [Podospora appendiculata]
MASLPNLNSALVEEAPKDTVSVPVSEHPETSEHQGQNEGQGQGQNEGQGENPGEVNGELDVDITETRPGKKTKGKKRGGKSKKPTGFEEFFCDPPLTQDEYEEERTSIYPSHRPFVDRIEECVQRFRARRRIDNDRNLFFSRYLFLGGVDSSPRQFQSTRNLGHETLEDATKAEVREITADDVIQRGIDSDARCYNPNNPEHWDVDFTGVAAGFFSESLLRLSGGDFSLYHKGVEVVSNFLKYVDRHDVCPDYADDLKNAQKVCEDALEEMPSITKALGLLPGEFQDAGQAFFCNDDNDQLSSFENQLNIEQSIDKRLARIRAGVTMAVFPGPKHMMPTPEVTTTKSYEKSFEICEVSLPDNQALAKYKSINQHLVGDTQVKPCGWIVARQATILDGWDTTTPEPTPNGPPMAFFLEEKILRLLKVGMKMSMGVRVLSNGVNIIKYVNNVYPTFYTFLPQELMLTYKEPIPNPRPAPSVNEPNAEEDTLNGALTGDAADE